MKPLIGNSVILRLLQSKDAARLALLANNRNIAVNLRDIFPQPYTLEDAQTFIGLQEDFEQKPLTLAIIFQGELCGIIGLSPQADVYRKCVELGYWVGEPHWGKGIATEAIALMEEYSFQQLGFHKIFASVFQYNVGSLRALEKNKFRLEGTLSEQVYKDGKYLDEYRYGKLNPFLSQ